MPNRIHTVTVGTETFTRESPRTYTHAIVITCTQAERDARVGAAAAKVAEIEDAIARATARLDNPGEAEAFAAASARMSHLHEDVTEQLRGLRDNTPVVRDGQPVTHTTPRYLSDTYIDAIEAELPASVESYRRRQARHTALNREIRAREALLATAQGAIDEYRDDLARAKSALDHAERRHVVGHVTCENWSQSAKVAAREARVAAGARDAYVAEGLDEAAAWARAEQHEGMTYDQACAAAEAA